MNAASPQQPPAPRGVPKNFLYNLAQVVTDAHTQAEMVHGLLRLAQHLTGLETVYLTRVDPERQELRVVEAENTPGAALQIHAGATVPWADTLCGKALATDTPFTAAARTLWADVPLVNKLGIETFLSQPLWGVHGTLLGTLCATSHRSVPVGDDARRIVGVFAQLIAYQIERDEASMDPPAPGAALANPNADPLTGLPNRPALETELAQRLGALAGPHRRLCLAFFDVQGLASVNDAHGHDVGDRLLIHIAERLRRALRPGEFLARVDGDEFVVVLHLNTVEPTCEAARIRRRFAGVVRSPYRIDRLAIRDLRVNIGAAVSQPFESVASLLRRADLAMFASRQARGYRRQLLLGGERPTPPLP